MSQIPCSVFNLFTFLGIGKKPYRYKNCNSIVIYFLDYLTHLRNALAHKK